MKKFLKKYFKFTRFRDKKCFRCFILLMILIVVGQCCNTNMSIDEIIITDLMLAGMFVFATLIVDWVEIIKITQKNDKKQ